MKGNSTDTAMIRSCNLRVLTRASARCFPRLVRGGDTHAGRSSLRLVPTLSPRQPPPVPTAEADEAEAIKLADVERRAAQMTAELEVGDHLDER